MPAPMSKGGERPPLAGVMQLLLLVMAGAGGLLLLPTVYELAVGVTRKSWEWKARLARLLRGGGWGWGWGAPREVGRGGGWWGMAWLMGRVGQVLCGKPKPPNSRSK